jgi:hypothetical protein
LAETHDGDPMITRTVEILGVVINLVEKGVSQFREEIKKNNNNNLDMMSVG